MSASHCNSLQLTATHCNTLQHTATHYWPSSTLCKSEHLKSAPHFLYKFSKVRYMVISPIKLSRKLTFENFSTHWNIDFIYLKSAAHFFFLSHIMGLLLRISSRMRGEGALCNIYGAVVPFGSKSSRFRISRKRAQYQIMLCKITIHLTFQNLYPIANRQKSSNVRSIVTSYINWSSNLILEKFYPPPFTSATDTQSQLSHL